MPDERAPESPPLSSPPEHLLVPLFAIALAFVYFFWQSVADQALLRTEFFGWPSGAAIAAQARAADDSPATQSARARLNLWGNVLALPLFLASLPLVFRAFPD